MFKHSYRRCRAGLLFLLMLAPFSTLAGGITLNSTRIIYPLEAKQSALTIRNTSVKSSFLVQSWVENADGSKSRDFVVTPPLYTSAPENENILRLIFIGKTPPSDRESLYYFNAKAIPSVDKKALANSNALVLAAVTRIKLFIRPQGLKPSSDAAPDELSFRREGGKMKIRNPTPYYLTLTDLKAGDQALKGLMVPPKGEVTVSLPSGSSHISFSTINDYGAVTQSKQILLK